MNKIHSNKNKKFWNITDTFLIFLPLLMSFSLSSFGTIWIITSSASTFVPSSITITLADSVEFSIASAHRVVEVSPATWNANDTTAIPGGFQTPFGGGLIDSTQLQEGTHYYVCVPHAAGGMKGLITVQHHAGISENQSFVNVSIHPNPVIDILNVMIIGKSFESCTALISDVTGREFLRTEVRINAGEIKIAIPVNSQGMKKGIYLLSILANNGTTTRKFIVL